jgi:ABC-2 type transport system ATP-binding protein
LSEAAILELDGLRKEYLDVVAVCDVSLAIPRGEIYGLIGPNGAGKTTLLSMAATTLEPTAGHVRLDGGELWDDPVRARRQIGFMPDFFQVTRELTVTDFLSTFALAHGLRGQALRDRVAEVVALVGLQAKAEEKCKGLSRGMVQRLGLGRAIIHKPALLLLDEPASGLDPLARKVLFDTLRAIHRDGSTIVISSHILSELSDLCTFVGIMHEGEFLECGRTREVIQKLLPRRRMELHVLAESLTAAQAFLEQTDAVNALVEVDGSLRFEFEGTDEHLADLHATLAREGIRIVTLAESATSLHEAYFSLAEGRPARD